MIPKDKAQEILKRAAEINRPYIGRFDKFTGQSIDNALFVVQEIINANPYSNPINTTIHSTMDYWLEVKKYIIEFSETY